MTARMFYAAGLGYGFEYKSSITIGGAAVGYVNAIGGVAITPAMLRP